MVTTPIWPRRLAALNLKTLMLACTGYWQGKNFGVAILQHGTSKIFTIGLYLEGKELDTQDAQFYSGEMVSGDVRVNRASMSYGNAGWARLVDGTATGWSIIAAAVRLRRHSESGEPVRIPIMPILGCAATKPHRARRPRDGPVILSERGAHMTRRSIANWFSATYAELGLDGCSSHSDRRTFITRSARMLAKTGGSLHDLQELVGHRDLATTQRYIEGNRDAQRKLIELI
jgi:hypothetical protein